MATGGPGLVAVGFTHRVVGGRAIAAATAWTSRDGLGWERASVPTVPAEGPDSEVMNALTVGGPGFVAVGTRFGVSDDPQGVVWTSANGRTWERAPDDGAFLDARVRDVIATGSALVAVGEVDGAGAVWTSNDGRRWERAADPEGAFARASMVAVTAGGPGLVAAGYDFAEPRSNGVAWVSADGRRWERVAGHETFAGAPVSDVTVGGPGLVAVGPSTIWVSADGRRWEPVPADRAVFDECSQLDVVANVGAGLLAFGFEEGAGTCSFATAMWVSSDGRSWERTPGGDEFDRHRVSAVAVAGRRLVAVGTAVWTAELPS